MSFSTSHTNVSSIDDITVDKLGTAPSARHLEQFEAGKKVAGILMESGAVGAGPFSVSIHGHAGAVEPTGGDSVGVSIMKAYPVAG